MLQEYEITSVIGEGGFGIVYRARDLHLNRDVAIKEYMPPALATRNAELGISVLTGKHKSTFDIGLRSFVAEARLMAQFKHPVLVDILRFWQQNQTAYMAMPFYDGPTLKALIARGDTIVDETWVRALLEPLLDGLQQMHDASCFHRDISPDNILILSDSGGPLLLDFGAARRIAAELTQGITVILKPGYAPVEQYTDDPSIVQGPWTDIYGLAAVCRHAITSKSLVASVTRLMRDPLEPLESLKPPGFSIEFLRAIDKGLAVRPEDRPQSLGEFRAMFAVGSRVAAARANDLAPAYSKTKADLVLVANPQPADARSEEPEIVATPPPNRVIGVVNPALKDRSRDVTITFGTPPIPSAKIPAQTKAGAPSPASLLPPQPVVEPVKPIAATRFTAVVESTRPIEPTLHVNAPVPQLAAARSPVLKLWTLASNRALVVMAGLVLVGSAVILVRVNQESAPALDPAASSTPVQDPVAAASSPAVEAASATAQPDKGLQISDAAVVQILPLVVPSAPMVKNTPQPPLAGVPEGVGLPALNASKSLAAAPGAQQLQNSTRPMPAELATPNRSGAASDTPNLKAAAIVGTLQLDIRPWGEILINGESRGVSPPMKQLSLPEGRYDVSVTNPGSQPHFRSIEVFVGRSVSIRHEFQSP